MLWCLCSEVVQAAGVQIDVEVSADFSYEVKLNGDRWLQSSPVRAYFNHMEYPAPTRVGTVSVHSGIDEIGAFSAHAQNWTAGSVPFSTAIKIYAAPGTFVFETQVHGGAHGTNSSVPIVPGGWPGDQGNVKPIIAFPAFSTAPDAVSSTALYGHQIVFLWFIGALLLLPQNQGGRRH